MTWIERISNDLAHWRVKNFFVRWKKKGWNLRQASDAWHCVEQDVKRWVPEDRAEALLKEGRSKLHLKRLEG